MYFNFNLRHAYIRIKSYLGRPRTITQKRPVIIEKKDRCQVPIFVIGCHRSGTSLCRRILNAHSNIACPPETYYLSHFASMIRDKNTIAGFRGLGYHNESEIFDEIRIWATRYHEAYRLLVGKSRWADKTPQYVSILPEIEQLFTNSIQYVFVIRNPLDIVYSIYKKGWNFGDYHSDALLNTAHYVSDTLNKIIGFSIKNQALSFTIKFEQLINNPRSTLQNLFQFLNEPWEPSVLEYHKFDHNFGVEDPVVRGTKGFIKNFNNWKYLDRSKLDRILPILNPIILQLGYKSPQID